MTPTRLDIERYRRLGFWKYFRRHVDGNTSCHRNVHTHYFVTVADRANTFTVADYIYSSKRWWRPIRNRIQRERQAFGRRVQGDKAKVEAREAT